jgi:hypothetical protein
MSVKGLAADMKPEQEGRHIQHGLVGIGATYHVIDLEEKVTGYILKGSDRS